MDRFASGEPCDSMDQESALQANTGKLVAEALVPSTLPCFMLFELCGYCMLAAGFEPSHGMQARIAKRFFFAMRIVSGFTICTAPSWGALRTMEHARDLGGSAICAVARRQTVGTGSNARPGESVVDPQPASCQGVNTRPHEATANACVFEPGG